MSLQQFLSVLWARRWLALLILGLCVGAGVASGLLMPRKYTASASLLIDTSRNDPLTASPYWSGPSPSYLSTQIDILTSTRVAQQVVRSLKLTERADLRVLWEKDAKDSGGGIDLENWLVARLGKAIEVKPARDSNVVTLSVTAPEALEAAQLANAFAQAYLDVALSLRVDPARQFSALFDGRSRELRASMEKAQAKLVEFQREKGVIVTDDRIDVEVARLNELSSQLTALQAVAAESSSRQVLVQSGSGEGLQEVLGHPMLVGMRSDLGHAEARLQELSARLGENHPQVLEATASIASLRSRLEIETRRVAGSVGLANSVNRSREAQRSKVLRLRSVRDEGLALLREVETARQAYEGVIGRLNQTHLESQATLGNAHILGAATPPQTPTSPRPLVNAAASLAIGLLLALGAVVASESADPHVRSLQDAQEQLGLPCLGVMPGPRGGAGFRAGRSPLVLPRSSARLPATSRS
jgi:chain length determinant protein EpsF